MTNQINLKDRDKLINCVNCGLPNPTTQQYGSFIDDGLVFYANNIGYYGGFTDNFPPQKGDDALHLCHDCCVILFNALPGFAKSAGVIGGHGNLNNRPNEDINSLDVPPCCAYAWTWEDSDPNNIVTYIATPNLTWEKRIYKDETV